MAQLNGIFDELNGLLDEAAAKVQDWLTGGQGELATAGGPSASRPSVSRAEGPDVDGQVMRSQSETNASGSTRVPWRGVPQLLDGTRRWGWIHIEGRHITGSIPGPVTDFFPPGTTRSQIEEAIQEVVYDT